MDDERHHLLRLQFIVHNDGSLVFVCRISAGAGSISREASALTVSEGNVPVDSETRPIVYLCVLEEDARSGALMHGMMCTPPAEYSFCGLAVSRCLSIGLVYYAFMHCLR